MANQDAQAFRDWVANEATREEIEKAKQSPMWMPLMYGGTDVDKEGLKEIIQWEIGNFIEKYPRLAEWMEKMGK